MSIDRTTSANSTVTCLYSAASGVAASCDPHASQNRAPSRGPCHTTRTLPPPSHADLHPRSSPWPSRCVLRSQAIPPSRGSDSPSPGRQRRRRGPGPAARAAAAARCRASPDPSSAGAAANRSIAASASATSPSAATVQQRLHQNTRRGNAPRQQLSLAEASWSTAARMSGIASSRSPRRALSRARYTLTSRNSLRLCPRRTNTSPTSVQELLSAVTLRIRVAVHQRKAQSHPGVGQRHDRHRIVRQSVGHPRSRARPDRRAASTPNGIPGK